MIQADAGNHGNLRTTNVRRVEPAAQAHLEDGRVDLGPGEPQQRQGRDDLEIGGSIRASLVGRGLLVHGLDGGPQLVDQFPENRGRTAFSVDGQTLFDAVQVRRAVRPVCRPADCSTLAIIAAVEPLPLVPPT